MALDNTVQLHPQATPVHHGSAAIAVERISPRSVRISITDRCDMACLYCRPGHGEQYVASRDRLDGTQWIVVLRGLVEAGVRAIRITGGEPLLHRGVVDIVAQIHALGVDDLALTTNASRLEKLARPLRSAGLRRVNISIDSLDATRFASMTRTGDLAEVMRGIDAACAVGFEEIKTNTVVLRGHNEDELEAITKWAWSRGITPRFLELMAVGEGARLGRDALVPYAAMRASLAHLLVDEEAVVDPLRGPARYVHAREGTGRVGFITGSTHTYCDQCDRLRVTSDGTLRPCLSTNDGVSVADLVRKPHLRTNSLVRERLAQAWALKPDSDWKGCAESTAASVSMRGTGG